MIRLGIVLLIVQTVTTIHAFEPSPSDLGNVPTWTAEQVRLWAADHASGANALDAESRAIACSIDRKKEDQCQQAALMQRVLADLAIHDRNRAAAEGLTVYYRIVSLQQQLETLYEAEDTLDALIQLAEKAAELEIAEGNANDLQQQRLKIRSQKIDAEYGIQKLQIRLARLTCQPLSVAKQAVLIDPIETEVSTLDEEAAVADGLQRRADLRAIHTLCRCINNDTAPAARTMLGAIQPGLGLAATVATKSSLLSGLCDQGQDACARRDQCRQLAAQQQGTIEDEIRMAWLELQASLQRDRLSQERVELANQAAQQANRAVEIEQRPAGTDLQASLEALRVQGERQARQLEQTLADVKLLEARGAAFPL
ncbi:hypothetical protein FF011L_52640 [Roseimaritima multifibrata]|uniref:Chromosome partition protein Smc n=1 Tax=Roseimaritima multifibrata TaxID=1930274 RepID=A0A517MNJ0_9BACT|nr:hypothetical protein [Roseimaritima multifibrata]QDS96453.1 hypothetical protein FF011L_52640 [Roseimaritima multifibrata]